MTSYVRQPEVLTVWLVTDVDHESRSVTTTMHYTRAGAVAQARDVINSYREGLRAADGTVDGAGVDAALRDFNETEATEVPHFGGGDPNAAFYVTVQCDRVRE